MNSALLLKETQRAFLLFVLLALGIGVYGILFVKLYKVGPEQLPDMLKSAPMIPQAMRQEGGLRSFENYLALGYSYPVPLVLIGAWSIGRAVQAVASEIEDGTLGWMLAYPVARIHFMLSKAVVLLVGMILLSCLLGFGFWETSLLLGFSTPSLEIFAKLSLNTILLQGAVAMLTLWASATSSDRGRPSLIGGSLFILSYLINFAAHIWKPLKSLQWLSLFAYYEPRKILLDNSLPWRDSAVLGGLMLVGLVAALWSFRKRELNI